jgi:hypothetical protein
MVAKPKKFSTTFVFNTFQIPSLSQLKTGHSSDCSRPPDCTTTSNDNCHISQTRVDNNMISDALELGKVRTSSYYHKIFMILGRTKTEIQNKEHKLLQKTATVEIDKANPNFIKQYL